MEGESNYTPSSPETVEDTLQQICAQLAADDESQLTPVEYHYDGQPPSEQLFQVYRGDEQDKAGNHSKIIHKLLMALNSSDYAMYSVTLHTLHRGTEAQENVIRVETINHQKS